MEEKHPQAFLLQLDSGPGAEEERGAGPQDVPSCHQDRLRKDAQDRLQVNAQPILVSLRAHSLSVSALVVVSDGRGLTFGVAVKLSYH